MDACIIFQYHDVKKMMMLLLKSDLSLANDAAADGIVHVWLDGFLV